MVMGGIAAAIHVDRYNRTMQGSLMELQAAIRRNDVDSLLAEAAAGAPVNYREVTLLETESVLMMAAENPSVHLDTLKALVQSGADPGFKAGELIRRAATTGDLERVKYLQGLGCPIEEDDSYGRTVLHRALECDRTVRPNDLVEYLLQAGFDPSKRAANGDYPITRCFWRKDRETACLLLRHDTMESVYDWTPLFSAVVTGDYDAFCEHERDVHTTLQSSTGFWSPLRVAIRFGDVRAAETLAELGADLHLGDGMPDLFEYAVESGHTEAMEWAFQNICAGSVDGARHRGLHEAAVAGRSLKAAKWLVDHGIYPPTGSYDDWEDCITDTRSLEMLDFYLDLGVHIESRGFHGTMLSNAAGNGWVEGARRLIERGANLQGTFTGSIPLHYAVKRDSDEMVDLLISAGSKIDVEDVDWDTPLFLVESLSVARKLIAAGADPDYPHWVYGSAKKHLLSRDVAFSRLFGES